MNNRSSQEHWLRHLPIGAEVQKDKGVHFRLWAPRRKRVEVVLEGKSLAQNQVANNKPVTHALSPEPGGYFSGYVPEAGENTLYRYRLDNQERMFPDPASRFQPEGPGGPSLVLGPSRYQWQDQHWKGVKLPGQVLYELHIGTFTPEGTWQAAIKRLPHLKETGITVLELMPVAEFPGRFGWGYDGVGLFAPTRLYGKPDDFRHFVDRVHAAGLGIILDVVYNHLGPADNYLNQFAQEYFTDRYMNEWGRAMNFDGPDAAPVREFFISNAGYWIEEFHLDGLRLDATQTIYDNSSRHILLDIRQKVQAVARNRATIIVAENEIQDPKLLHSPGRGGYGFDGVWNDDFHHSMRVAATGRKEAYYQDYCGSPQELISSIRHGYLYQGQRYAWQQKRRGKLNLHQDPACFIIYLQNHDQIANSALGLRLHDLTDYSRLRALTALLLLAPGTPMLFQGQEYATKAPFLYFADHKPELAKQVAKGRKEFVSQFASIGLADPEIVIADPADPATFERCKLQPEEEKQGLHAKIHALHRDLLTLRRQDPAFGVQRLGGVDGAVLGPEAFVLRFFGEQDEGDRLLIVNLGCWLYFPSVAEPLLAPPVGCEWHLLLSTESPLYGGTGGISPEQSGAWSLQSHAAAVLAPSKDIKGETHHA